MSGNDHDRELVQKAYDAKVESLVTGLFAVLITAEEADEIESAERRFQIVVTKTRKARDRALELLPSSTV